VNTILLYATTVLIWGSTWLAITFQLGSVDPMLSIAYRFTVASVVLLVACKLLGLNMRFGPRQHLFIALQGLFLFSVNYWLVYLAEQRLTSGLVAVVFSTMVFMNIFNGALLLRSPIHLRVLLGAILGLAGIGLVFWPELSSFSLSDRGLTGLLLCILGTFSASVGNILSARNQKDALPVVQTNAYGMAYGAAIMLLLALASGKPFRFQVSPAYVLSLLYLGLFGSVVAFGSYLTLVGRIGADRAAYATLLFPIVALILSTLFEGYRWTGYAFAGVGLILAGNILALSREKGRKRAVSSSL